MTIEFGAEIPHIHGKPFPYDPFTEVMVKYGGFWQAAWSAANYEWVGHCMRPITAYRLPADHHAYGPRVSRFDREPDAFANQYLEEWYPAGALGYFFHAERRHADSIMAKPSTGLKRLGVWRIYRKEPA